ncbi:MAG: hypothetical protein COV74_10355 [Candidatus Omnitrophica bacterium CG11_big_fil_rev_8_21_14_0_20_45_26]|uniref:Uncharacterized protein n=1 Tax=Candidatus Abzuiibacterium crystallinum TaxID=1974748 RepID=A0A2H0LKS6_9BACT|nr:MAG: hypothetical protein COV74_10355 [Candidatus Omnitrophica bacterium CG11_big_fil_rev_8_21_14_0_20_45_26]PIW63930.1 MAG: hypothetical protein COW12_08465 [Candidatus Omnitrophica bacterium CG12_big_fil_rev_8_21_14_0_65_45_16]
MVGVIFCILFLGLWIPGVFSKTPTTESPETIANRVYNDIRVANELTAQAAKTLRLSDDQKSKEVAVHLYVEAGKLFEKSHHVLQALGPDHVPQADIDGSYEAMKTCIDAVNRIKQHM